MLDGQLALSSPSLRAVARGALDLANNRYRQLRLGIDLLRPPALFPNMTGRNVRMVWTLDGPFATADYAYRLTSPGVKFDNTGFVDVHAEGRGQAVAVADARAAAAAGAGDHRGRRRRRRDPRQRRGSRGCWRSRRSWCAATGCELTSDKLNGKIVAADRPRHRPVRDRSFPAA